MATPGQQVPGPQQQNAPQQHQQPQGQEADPIVQFKELIPRLKASLVVSDFSTYLTNNKFFLHYRPTLNRRLLLGYRCPPPITSAATKQKLFIACISFIKHYEQILSDTLRSPSAISSLGSNTATQ